MWFRNSQALYENRFAQWLLTNLLFYFFARIAFSIKNIVNANGMDSGVNQNRFNCPRCRKLYKSRYFFKVHQKICYRSLSLEQRSLMEERSGVKINDEGKQSNSENQVEIVNENDVNKDLQTNKQQQSPAEIVNQHDVNNDMKPNNEQLDHFDKLKIFLMEESSSMQPTEECISPTGSENHDVGAQLNHENQNQVICSFFNEWFFRIRANVLILIFMI